MRIVRSVLVLSAALAAVASQSVAGCGGTTQPTSASPTRSSGITGLIVMEGGPPMSSPRPQPDVQIEVRQGDETGDVVETVRSGADGTFTVDLPPGHYTVVPITLGDAMVLPASAIVTPGEYVYVRVEFAVK